MHLQYIVSALEQCVCSSPFCAANAISLMFNRSHLTPHASRLTHPVLRIAAFLLLLANLSACAETPRITPAPATLRIAASSTLSALIGDLGGLYRADHPWVTIQTEPVNSSTAVGLLNEGASDLACVSWLPPELDPAAWRSALAQDAVAVIINAANPVTGLSLAQLRDVFQGRALDWSGFGWTGESLVVVSRESGSGTRAVFEQAVLGGQAVTLTAIVQADGDSVVAYVAQTPGAIGYVSRGRVTAGVKPIAIDGVEPSPANAANGSYPIGRTLFVVAREEPTGAARDFVVWLLGADGQRAIAERGFGRVK
jgi:phosphate transport system substrate-binding protein